MSRGLSWVAGRSIALSFYGISLVALTLAAGISVAGAQQVLDPITVVATKTEEKVINSLAAISAVRDEQIRQILPKRLSDIFVATPGIEFQNRGDDPSTAVNIRGLQDFGRVAVVVDGARQNFQRTGHTANGAFFLDTELLAAADVVRGPTANIYGSGAIGGVVSFRTKDVEDILRPGERYGALANAEVGSNTVRGLASLFGAVRVNPNVEFIAGGSYRMQGTIGTAITTSCKTAGTRSAARSPRVHSARPMATRSSSAERSRISGTISASRTAVRARRTRARPSTRPTCRTRPRPRAGSTAVPTTCC